MNINNYFYSLIENTDTFLLVIFYIFTSIQILYYAFFYARIFTFKKLDNIESKFNEPVSVIIAAHNEAENLKKFLPSILKQDYSTFEVIVINDRSEDDTDTILAQLKEKYPHLRTTFIKNNGKLKHGKKLAITLGVKASQYEYILLTDADCKAASNQWIKQTVKYFDNADIILSYGPYFTEKSFVNKLIRFDTLFIAMQYMTFAKAGFTYMGIGRNLAYKKELFVNNKGLASHAHLNSGDDDLFINEVANKKNVAISYQPKSFTYSIPEKTFKDWVRQKQRHLTTFKRYKKSHQFLLGGEVFSRVAFYSLFIGLFLLNYTNYYFLVFALSRYLLSFIVIHKSAKVFREKGLIFFIILLDFVFPILNLFIYFSSKKETY